MMMIRPFRDKIKPYKMVRFHALCLRAPLPLF